MATAVRLVGPEPRFLAEGWLRFEAPFGRACAPSVRPREGPSLEGLQEVMVVAEKRQVVQLGGSVLGEWDHMVDLQAERHPAPGHHADPVAMRQRRPELPVEGPTEVGDGPDVAGFMEDEAKERVIGHVPRHAHWDRPLVVDLTTLSGKGTAAEEGLEVYSHHDRAGRGPIDDALWVDRRLTHGNPWTSRRRA